MATGDSIVDTLIRDTSRLWNTTAGGIVGPDLQAASPPMRGPPGKAHDVSSCTADPFTLQHAVGFLRHRSGRLTVLQQVADPDHQDASCETGPPRQRVQFVHRCPQRVPASGDRDQATGDDVSAGDLVLDAMPIQDGQRVGVHPHHEPDDVMEAIGEPTPHAHARSRRDAFQSVPARLSVPHELYSRPRAEPLTEEPI